MNKIVISAVIKNKEGKLLAVHLNKEKPEGVWVMPGGKLEDDESARDCAVREVHEELGVKIRVGKIIGIGEVDYGKNNSWIFIYYDAEILSGVPVPQEHGKTLDVKYVNLEQIHMYEKIRWISPSTTPSGHQFFDYLDHSQNSH